MKKFFSALVLFFGLGVPAIVDAKFIVDDIVVGVVKVGVEVVKGTALLLNPDLVVEGGLKLEPYRPQYERVRTQGLSIQIGRPRRISSGPPKGVWYGPRFRPHRRHR